MAISKTLSRIVKSMRERRAGRVVSPSPIFGDRAKRLFQNAVKDWWCFYKDAAGKFRWVRFCWRNGEITGAATEGYSKKIDCTKNAIQNGFIPGKSQVIDAADIDCIAS